MQSFQRLCGIAFVQCWTLKVHSMSYRSKMSWTSIRVEYALKVIVCIAPHTITCRVFQHVGSFKIEVSLPRLSTNAFSKNPKFSGMIHLLDLHVSPNFEGSRINICGGNPSWKCQISNVCDRVCVTMAAKAQIALLLFGKTISEHCSYIRLYSN